MRLLKIQKNKSWRNKIVLLRCDMNVPVHSGRVTDDSRIRSSLPSIIGLSRLGAKVVVVSHLGRPGGKKISSLTLKPVAKRLSTRLKKPVEFFMAAIGSKVLKKKINAMQSGDIVILENIRFYPGEKKNSATFVKQLASLADVYVNDGFAVAHRDTASVSGVTKFLPSYAGLLIQSEIAAMKKALRPKKPAVLIIGGIKIETKLPAIRNLLPKFDYVLVSGGVFNTMLAAKGYGIGSSRIDKKYFKEALWLWRQKKVMTPVDIAMGTREGKRVRHIAVPRTKAQLGKAPLEVMDIGPATITLYEEIIATTKTIVWNGPVGYSEQKQYRLGMDALGTAVGKRAKAGHFVLIGGGETVESMRRHNMLQYITHVSTGGGAMLEYLSGKSLPGLSALGK